MPKEAKRVSLSNLSDSQFLAGKIRLFNALYGVTADGTAELQGELSRQFQEEKISEREFLTSIELLSIAHRIYRRLDK